MTRPTLLIAALGLGLLAACGGTDRRIAVPAIEPAARVGIAYASVEVRDVTLPVYAQLEEIAFEAEDGTIATDRNLLWADEPARATTLELARALSTITNARVASEPWPFESFPEARVEVRIEEMLATRSGAFRLSGQYFVGALDGSGRERARTFRLTVPLAPEAGAGAIAAARGQAIADLAERIARDGLG